jgi:23S rRNA (adenine2503-C2)-methyltransferase
MNASLPSLFDLPLDGLPLPAEGQQYRRAQLADWLYLQGVQDFAAMTNLPLDWRQELAAGWRISPFTRIERFPSADDSIRYLFTLADGKQTEAVYMPYANRRTICVSSMVGCPAGCAFCATGAMGFGRNLSRGEIVAQLLAVAWHEGFPPRAIRNVVLMGMGEALLNYANAVGAIRTWLDPAGLDMSPRRITLSTVGLPNRLRKLIAEDLPVALAVSLHAPDEETRRQIIPTAHAHSIADIIASLHEWQQAHRRRVSIEYTMLEGINDHLWQADRLVELLEGLTSHVNLIPFNAWGESEFNSSSRSVIDAFRSRIEKGGVSVSVRFSRGQDAGAACGQLSLQRRADVLPAGDAIPLVMAR